MINHLKFKNIISIFKSKNKDTTMKQDIKKIQSKLESIWYYTDMELDDFSTIGLKKYLNAISGIVNDTLHDLSMLSDKHCSVCSNDVCEPCLDDMEKELAPSNDK
jgi:delta-aminolevulinic acid dehydratase/porphobilinogen synthase